MTTDPTQGENRDETPGDDTNAAASPQSTGGESPASPDAAGEATLETPAAPEAPAAAAAPTPAATPSAAAEESTPSAAASDDSDSAAPPELEVPSSELPELTLGGGQPGAPGEIDPDYQPTIRGKIDRFGVAMGTGRRKTAVARVRIKDGAGAFTINDRPLDEFISVERDRAMVQAPLKLVDKLGSVDVSVRVKGGGTTGQTGAIVLGVARALQGMNEAWHSVLSDAGYLTRDDRMVERKKFGYRKARRSYQFSKR